MTSVPGAGTETSPKRAGSSSSSNLDHHRGMAVKKYSVLERRSTFEGKEVRVLLTSF